jgi:hypothetical protein
MVLWCNRQCILNVNVITCIILQHPSYSASHIYKCSFATPVATHSSDCVAAMCLYSMHAPNRRTCMLLTRGRWRIRCAAATHTTRAECWTSTRCAAQHRCLWALTTLRSLATGALLARGGAPSRRSRPSQLQSSLMELTPLCCRCDGRSAYHVFFVALGWSISSTTAPLLPASCGFALSVALLLLVECPMSGTCQCHCRSTTAALRLPLAGHGHRIPLQAGAAHGWRAAGCRSGCTSPRRPGAAAGSGQYSSARQWRRLAGLERCTCAGAYAGECRVSRGSG